MQPGQALGGDGGQPALARPWALSRRRYLTSFAVTAGSAVAAACAPLSDQPGAGQRPAIDKSQKAELIWFLVFGDSGDRKNGYDAITRRFNEQFPNVTVTRVNQEYNVQPVEKMITLMAGGVPLDVVGTRPDLVGQMMEGPKPLADLRKFLKKDSSAIKESDHVQGPLAALTWKGTLYALPQGAYTNIVAINLDILARNGIKPPGPNWTIDEALDIAQRTTQRRESDDESIWGMEQHWSIITHFPYSFIRGNGGEPLVPNEEITKSQFATDGETVKTIQWLVDLSHKQRLMPVKHTFVTAFLQGRNTLCYLETQNMVVVLRNQQQGGPRFNYDVQHWPMMKKGRYYPDRSYACGMGSTAKNPDLAFELYKHIAGPTGQLDWYNTNKMVPTIKSLLNTTFLQDPDPPKNRKAIVEAMEAVKPMPKSRYWWEIDQDTIVKAFADLRAGNVAVNAGLADLDRKISVILQRK